MPTPLAHVATLAFGPLEKNVAADFDDWLVSVETHQGLPSDGPYALILNAGYRCMLLFVTQTVWKQYGHLSKQLVDENQTVKPANLLVLGGNTGRSTGSTLLQNPLQETRNPAFHV